MFSRYGFRMMHSACLNQKFLSSKLKFNLIHKTNNKSLQCDEIVVFLRTLSSNTQQNTTKPPSQPRPAPPPPSKATASQQESAQKCQLQHVKESQKQLMYSQQELDKIKAKQIDIVGKKLGWLVSGTAIALISALYGKLYLLCGAVPLFLFHSKDIDVMSKTFNRDILFLWRSCKCWWLSKRIKNQNLTLPKVFQLMAKKYADRMMLQMHDQHWKYKDVASYANRTSRLMQKYGFQKGDIVAMFALNSPEMVAIVLGLANIGVITALINTDLRSKGLSQAILNTRCKGIVFDDELMHAFGDVYKNFNDIKIFQTRHKAKRPEFRVLEEELLKEFNDAPEMFINIHHHDPLVYMYSSDDTDYKEPIVITHAKFLFNSSATALMLDLNPSEKIYNPTPLHDPTGMILGIGPSITNAVPTVLRSKFSAVDYFKECYVYNCTVGQYTGTMCKHLLLSPVSPIETFHPVKVMYGNGLESDYWQEFVNRFGTKMYEVYDPSEENINLINMEGKIGVVGFRPKITPSVLFPHYIIKVFGNEKIPIRDPTGLCQLCEYGEPGMLVRLWNRQTPLPTKIKTISNIFKDGDVAITNGEILTFDENLYLRPLKKHTDKRWMNKLVTSEEVEYIASKFTSKRCAAYSLSMGYKQDIEILAIEDSNKTLNMKKFTDDLVEHLPKDWIPHYVRIVPKFELLVDSNKVNKKSLILQGLNLEDNLLYYFDKNSMSYNLLIWTQDNRSKLIHGLEKTAITPKPSTNLETPQNAINKQIAERFKESPGTKKVVQSSTQSVQKPMDSISKMFVASNFNLETPKLCNDNMKSKDSVNVVTQKLTKCAPTPEAQTATQINHATSQKKMEAVPNVVDKSNTSTQQKQFVKPPGEATKLKPVANTVDKSGKQQQDKLAAAGNVALKAKFEVLEKLADKSKDKLEKTVSDTSTKIVSPQQKEEKVIAASIRLETVQKPAEKTIIAPPYKEKLAQPPTNAAVKVEAVQKVVIAPQQKEKLVRAVNVSAPNSVNNDPILKSSDKSINQPQQRDAISNENKVKTLQAQVIPKVEDQKEKSKRVKTEQAVIFINKTTNNLNPNQNPSKSTHSTEDTKPSNDASKKVNKDSVKK